MEGRSAVWLLAALLLEALISAEAKNSPQYLEVDKKLVLSPEPVSDIITSITWKLDGSIVGEWVNVTLPLDFSPAFKGRANVDKTTGVLEINNMMKTDSGVYTVEINDRIQSGSHDIRVITQVPEPQAVIGPLTCSQSSESCSLSCRGEVTEAGPVTFYIKKGDGDWEEGKQNIEIMNDEDTQAVKTFSCRMKNPLGEKDSEPVENRFYREPSTGNTAGIVVGVLFLIVACIGVAVVVYLKKCKGSRTTTETPAASPQDNGGMQEAPLLMQPQNEDKREDESANVMQSETADKAKEEPDNIINSDPKEVV